MRTRTLSETFFSEEKKQKTYMSLSRITPAEHRKRQKFSGSFFQKRTASFLPNFHDQP
jgi:hypothetical protein